MSHTEQSPHASDRHSCRNEVVMRTQRGFVLPSPTLIMAGVIIALSLSNVVFFKLYRSTADEYAQFKADVSAQQMAIQRDNERKQAEAEQAVLDVSISWQRALDYARRNPPVRVLPANCHSGTDLKAPGTGQGLNAATAEPGPDSAVDVALEECSDRLNKAVIDAAQVLHLQAYINRLCNVYGCE